MIFNKSKIKLNESLDDTFEWDWDEESIDYLDREDETFSPIKGNDDFEMESKEDSDAKNILDMIESRLDMLLDDNTLIIVEKGRYEDKDAPKIVLPVGENELNMLSKRFPLQVTKKQEAEEDKSDIIRESLKGKLEDNIIDALIEGVKKLNTPKKPKQKVVDSLVEEDDDFEGMSDEMIRELLMKSQSMEAPKMEEQLIDRFSPSISAAPTQLSSDFTPKCNPSQDAKAMSASDLQAQLAEEQVNISDIDDNF